MVASLGFFVWVFCSVFVWLADWRCFGFDLWLIGVCVLGCVA